jgi:hypothetical protein
MYISHTPGTSKDYADAKAAEDTLKQQIQNDKKVRTAETLRKKATKSAGFALHSRLVADLTSVDAICCAIDLSGNVLCVAPATTSDSLCDAHRSRLATAADNIAKQMTTNHTLPIGVRGPVLEIFQTAFREGVAAARIIRFGTPVFAPPPAVVAATAAGRRVAEAPILTAPVDVASHVAKQHLEMSIALGKPISCPICYDVVTVENVAMTHCGHVYCTPCLTEVRVRERKCPQCRVVI